MAKTNIELVKTNEPQDIESIEKEFSAFLKKSEETTSSISGHINMDELNEIGDEIVKARQYLESFATGEKKTIREKAYNQLTTLPMIGGWAKEQADRAQIQNIKDSSVKEVLTDIFDKFEIKKKRILDLTEISNKIGTELQKQEKYLEEYIKSLDNIIENTQDAGTKLRAYDMSNQAQYQDKVVKDQIYNKLAFIVELMEQLYMRMSKTVPAIKAQLMNETEIAGMINNISDTVKMLSELHELTNNISRTSTEKVQELIVDVTKDLTDGSDIKFYEESHNRNIKIQETLKESRLKVINNTVDKYNKLKEISTNTNYALEDSSKATQKALGIIESVE